MTARDPGSRYPASHVWELFVLPDAPMTMMAALVSRRLICRLLIGVLVSTQLAIAAYACNGIARMAMPGQGLPITAAMAMDRSGAADPAGSISAAAANQDEGPGPGCSRLDPALPNLCVAHHQYGQQSADHSPAPTVPAALLIGLYTLAPPGASSERASSPAGLGDPPAAVDPPHAVLHCCLRI